MTFHFEASPNFNPWICTSLDGVPSLCAQTHPWFVIGNLQWRITSLRSSRLAVASRSVRKAFVVGWKKKKTKKLRRRNSRDKQDKIYQVEDQLHVSRTARLYLFTLAAAMSNGKTEFLITRRINYVLSHWTTISAITYTYTHINTHINDSSQLRLVTRCRAPLLSIISHPPDHYHRRVPTSAKQRGAWPTSPGL